jgi:hypothetical protein
VVMTVSPEHNERVQVRLKGNVYDVSARIERIDTIREWINELVEWQPDMYSINIHYSGTIMDIWFKEKQHAVMCALRWA